MFKLPNWKQLLWIIIFAVISVLLRYSEAISSNWMWWGIAIVFVVVYEFLATKEAQEEDIVDINAEEDSSVEEDNAKKE